MIFKCQCCGRVWVEARRWVHAAVVGIHAICVCGAIAFTGIAEEPVTVQPMPPTVMMQSVSTSAVSSGYTFFPPIR